MNLGALLLTRLQILYYYFAGFFTNNFSVSWDPIQGTTWHLAVNVLKEFFFFKKKKIQSSLSIDRALTLGNLPHIIKKK